MDWQTPIYTRDDGSYVVTCNGHPYHVPNDGGFVGLWAEVNAYANNNKDCVTPEPVTEIPEVDRSQVIMRRLHSIDLESMRPMRAILDNVATQYDIEKLTKLEDEAEALRSELDSL